MERMSARYLYTLRKKKKSPNEFEEYKASRNGIPPLPEITREHKKLLIYPLISEYFCIPPNTSSKKIFIKGGHQFHESLK